MGFRIHLLGTYFRERQQEEAIFNSTNNDTSSTTIKTNVAIQTRATSSDGQEQDNGSLSYCSDTEDTTKSSSWGSSDRSAFQLSPSPSPRKHQHDQLVVPSLTASTSTSSAASPKRNFRSKYFRKLGILHSDSPSDRPSTRPTRTTTNSTIRAELLKMEGEMRDATLSLNSPPVSPSIQKGRHKKKLLEDDCTGVSFQSKVDIRTVPRRHDVPPSCIKESLWMSMPELRDIVERNTLEFADEGCKWHNVIEEDQFVYCNGEWLHPALYHHSYEACYRASSSLIRQQDKIEDHDARSLVACNLTRPFLQYMSAQQGHYSSNESTMTF
jgi:hypothetical protein